MWVRILPCVGYNLSVAYKMSEESRIKSCSSEVSDNPNLFSITHVEYGLSFEQVQAEMRTPEQWGVFLIDKMKMALGFLIHAQV